MWKFSEWISYKDLVLLIICQILNVWCNSVVDYYQERLGCFSQNILLKSFFFLLGRGQRSFIFLLNGTYKNINVVFFFETKYKCCFVVEFEFVMELSSILFYIGGWVRNIIEISILYSVMTSTRDDQYV